MVFTQELDRQRHPPDTRVWGIIIGTAVMMAITIALVSPRTIVVGVPAIGLAVLAGLARRGRLADARVRASPGVVLIAAFLALCGLSALWAFKPVAVLPCVLTAVGYIAAALAMVAALLREPRWSVFHIAEGLWVGLLAGLIYLGIEIFSGQIVKLSLYQWLDVPKVWLRPPMYFKWRGDELLSISPYDLTRNIAPVTLLLWPALLTLRKTAPHGRARLWQLLLFVVAAVVIGASEHETSKLGLAASTAIFALACWQPVWTHRLLVVGWVAACLAVVPVALEMKRMQVDKWPEIQYTMRHRIAIWNHTAEEALKRPLLGIGAGMMYQLDPSGVKITAGELRGTAPHAHNVYLQTWFELGAVGAALLTLIGLAVLARMRRLGNAVAPYADATFAAAMVMAAASYGMWQPWYIAMFALAVVMFAVGLRADGYESDSRPGS